MPFTNTTIVLTAPGAFSGDAPSLEETRNGVVTVGSVTIAQTFDFSRMEILSSEGYAGTLLDGTYVKILDPDGNAFTVSLAV